MFNDKRRHNNMPKKLNLLNERFGKLLVIKESENINGRTAWLC